MIDVERIRQDRTPKRVLLELLVNVPALFFILYGLKCLVLLDGRMLYVGRGAGNHSSLAPVVGTVAAVVGLAYIGFGLFIYLSDGNPPDEDQGWLWRIGRALLRWGGLVLGFWGFFRGHDLMSGTSPEPSGLPPFFEIEIASFIIGFFALLLFLGAMFQREQVKRELYERGCQPLHVWWRPAAYWVEWFDYLDPTGFRVVYADPAGNVHGAYCFVYRSLQGNPRWGTRRVRWLKDTVVAQAPSTDSWVDVDSEIIRPKLGSGDTRPDSSGFSSGHREAR